ncbi:MAG: glycosyltransferase [Chitinophagaceae bacterium]|nr:glycosyltransferase [Chitinophagaceae bacterium]
MSLRILILTPRIPFPLKDGGALAMYQSIEMYHKMGCEVSLLSMNTTKHWCNEEDLPSLFQQINYFESVKVETNINVFSAFKNLFGKKSYHIERFINKKFEKAFNTILETLEFDIIQFESIFTAPYLSLIEKDNKALKVARLHNIEFKIWEQLAKNEKNFLKKSYLQLLAKRLKEFELANLNLFDLLLPISENELQVLNTLGIETEKKYIPYGVEKFYFKTDAIEQEKDSIYFIGSMDWMPNQEGVEWFLESVWPRLTAHWKNLKFYIAGKNMPHNLFKKTKNVIMLGEIEDMKTFSLEKNILIVPLKSGAGLRIKILEAMALGKTIISTEAGVEGLGLEKNIHYLSANSAEAFERKIKLCIDEPAEAKTLGENAKKMCLEKFNKTEIYKNLITYFIFKTQVEK